MAKFAWNEEEILDDNLMERLGDDDWDGDWEDDGSCDVNDDWPEIDDAIYYYGDVDEDERSNDVG